MFWKSARDASTWYCFCTRQMRGSSSESSQRVKKQSASPATRPGASALHGWTPAIWTAVHSPSASSRPYVKTTARRKQTGTT